MRAATPFHFIAWYLTLRATIEWNFEFALRRFHYVRALLCKPHQQSCNNAHNYRLILSDSNGETWFNGGTLCGNAYFVHFTLQNWICACRGKIRDWFQAHSCRILSNEVDDRPSKFRNFTIVTVTYCSGDLHLGETTQPYTGPDGETVTQTGYRNFRSVLEWVKVQQINGRFASPLEELLYWALQPAASRRCCWPTKSRRKLIINTPLSSLTV